MGSEDDLNIGIELEDDLDKSFLPFYVQTYFRFIHKENIMLVILYQYGEQYGKHLLLATRQLIRCQFFFCLQEPYLVLRTYERLLRTGKQFINQILEFLFGF